MAWEIVSKATVADYVQMPTSDLNDIYYNGALEIISSHTGEYHIGSSGVSVTDILNGNGRSSVAVRKPPIISLTSVTIDGYTVDLNLLGTTKSTIYFKSNPNVISTLTYLPGTFSPGRGNVTVVYSSGLPLADVPDNYSIAIMLIIRELVTIPRAEGSDARLQYAVPDYRIMRRETLMQLGVGGKIRQICESMLPAKGRILIGA